MHGHFIYERLGHYITRKRYKMKLSQEEMAFRCGIDRTYLSRIEKGRANPSLRSLCKIAKILKTRLTKMFKYL
ncbi:XRE family transcriptional regulator [Candidatus Roizmanbacteria bacterium CG_4_10_14_0_2_um_filter_36_35]|uniref:XRE family transcriptional regulator n=5 Tax=Candidatus Roizmaniibacteriota TaxID=1752723 RepID=A0A2M8F4G9_9BACT|nr:helix-turn-helix transcriptional regulator [Candidatus Roizmanbacteria bacterium]PIP14632.1 MAG: transcriptional regulator [Candidatus Roizmanbacteria bacterium CG23_combo_of_CG06-09_8_20_14_all_35_49]PIP62995.1 MAG: transcriptional regulator [Candidatus Roizmanbacteria bacterium CG22_combo_CG10-13_8_21_14_all_35_9]PIY70684.1 MAG: XRE family transcriptional regulator [Candidatus Roizmanbacteria bacterium CG_4_10_14_0_8_um_filter_35_28]PIZ67317.1 MAG: XRE family transcriptional regulator [Can